MSSIESHLSNKPKQVFFNPINIFDTFTHSITLLYIFNKLFSFNVNFLIYSESKNASAAQTGPLYDPKGTGMSTPEHAGFLLAMGLQGHLKHGIKKPDVHDYLKARHSLKIADFGLARVHDPFSNDSYTHQVATRWYRAPELLFGARKYGVGVDLWAVGTIFGELLNHSPIFPGENDINQIYRVLQVLGTPTIELWPEVIDLPDFNKISFPTMTPIHLKHVVPNGSLPALDLLLSFLKYRPQNRRRVSNTKRRSGTRMEHCSYRHSDFY